MFKARLRLFSGVFLLAVGVAHSLPQVAAAKGSSDTAGSHDSVDLQQADMLSQSNDERSGTCSAVPPDLCFDEFLNIPIGDAILTLVGELGDLEVSNLSLSDESTAVGTACTVPTSGVEIALGSKAAKAGDDGYTVTKKRTKIPDDVTSYFVELAEYWGISCTGTAWVTDPIPIGFRTSGGSITACADFSVDPIFCSTVQVEFKKGSSTGVIECPAGNLFSVPDTTTITLKKVLARATCRNGNGSCAESASRDRAKLEFRLASEVSGLTEDAGCTVISGTSPFSAQRIFIKPKLSTCSETCSVSDRGGNTPPIRTMKILSASASRSRAQGSFIITQEAVGDIPTVGTWGLVVLVQLVLVAGTVVFRRQLPIVGTI